MTNKMPLRLTILHFAQRFLIDAVTFIPPISFNTSCPKRLKMRLLVQPKFLLYLLHFVSSRLSMIFMVGSG